MTEERTPQFRTETAPKGKPKNAAEAARLEALGREWRELRRRRAARSALRALERRLLGVAVGRARAWAEERGSLLPEVDLAARALHEAALAVALARGESGAAGTVAPAKARAVRAGEFPFTAAFDRALPDAAARLLSTGRLLDPDAARFLTPRRRALVGALVATAATLPRASARVLYAQVRLGLSLDAIARREGIEVDAVAHILREVTRAARARLAPDAARYHRPPRSAPTRRRP